MRFGWLQYLVSDFLQEKGLGESASLGHSWKHGLEPSLEQLSMRAATMPGVDAQDDGCLSELSTKCQSRNHKKSNWVIEGMTRTRAGSQLYK
jgi:hypothetical protein